MTSAHSAPRSRSRRTRCIRLQAPGSRLQSCRTICILHPFLPTSRHMHHARIRGASGSRLRAPELPHHLHPTYIPADVTSREIHQAPGSGLQAPELPPICIPHTFLPTLRHVYHTRIPTDVTSRALYKHSHRRYDHLTDARKASAPARPAWNFPPQDHHERDNRYRLGLPSATEDTCPFVCPPPCSSCSPAQA